MVEIGFFTMQRVVEVVLSMGFRVGGGERFQDQGRLVLEGMFEYFGRLLGFWEMVFVQVVELLY